MSTFISGIASAQSLDKSAEIVDIKGLDITSLSRTGVINFEHKSDIPAQICGKILKAKKIFSKDDCDTENETYFWNKAKVPFVYIIAELLDDYCQSGKDAAGLFRYDRDKKDKNAHSILGFSVEGSEIPNTRKGQLITRSIARKVTLTQAPCNSLCIAEIYEEPQKPQVQDDFDSIFKSKEEAITLFKSGEGVKMYESFLAKKESGLCELHKAQVPGSKYPPSSQAVSAPKVTFAATKFGPSHDVQKNPGSILGSTKSGKKVYSQAKIHEYPSFTSGEHKEAAEIHRLASQNAKTAAEKSHHFDKMKLHTQAAHTASLKENRLKTAMGNKEKALNKAIEAGSYNSAPSTLTNGAAYQRESLSSSQANTGAEDNTFQGTKKKDWKKRAKDDYENWPHKEKFEKFMQARMPQLAMGEIRAIGRTLALKKSIDFEKNLSELVLKTNK